jgi:peptide/nickel transport system permease protein
MMGRAKWSRLTTRQAAGLAVGSIIIAGLIFLAIFGRWLIPYDVETMHFDHLKEFPSREFLLGTDRFGRDVLSRLILGTSTTMLIAGASTALATILGTIIGLSSAFYGGLFDKIAMRVIDVFIAFPTLVFAMFVIGVLGSGVFNGIIVISLMFTPSIARVVRSAAISIVVLDYVNVARMRGERTLYILFNEVAPNLYPTLLVEASIRFGMAILVTAGLSYIGLGPPPPAPDWGTMASEGRSIMLSNPWPVFAPSIAIVMAVIGVNLLGDGIGALLVAKQSRASGTNVI